MTEREAPFALTLSGSIPALVTPFDASGAIDGAAFRDLVEWRIAEGSSALVACGTTGEAATLDIEEHFAALARAAALPIVIYNVPARTTADIQPATLARIVTAFPDVFVALKDSSGLLTRAAEHRALIGPDFPQLTGNDELALPFNACGGRGCISVTANIAPRLCAAFQEACRTGDFTRALRLQKSLFPLHAALFTDASPGPAKYALSRVRPGFPAALRLPLTPPSEASRSALDAALAHAGLV